MNPSKHIYHGLDTYATYAPSQYKSVKKQIFYGKISEKSDFYTFCGISPHSATNLGIFNRHFL